MARVRRTLRILCFFVLLLAVVVLSMPLLMRYSVASIIYATPESAPEREIAIVLGASVVRGEPSPVLAARADVAAELYQKARVKKILVTGDSADPSHDEVTPVHKYLLAAGVKDEDIMLDTVGLDTYSSMHRAHSLYGATSALVVTQDFHMPRAIFLARRLGIDASGVVARGGGSSYFAYVREIPASWKALLDVLTEREPKYMNMTQQ